MAVGSSLGGVISVPSLYVARVASQSAGARTTLLFDTKIMDSENWFNTANGRYTPQVEGYYIFFTKVSGSASPLFAVNGITTSSSDFLTVLFNGTTDYITVTIENTTGTGGAQNNGVYPTWLYGAYVG